MHDDGGQQAAGPEIDRRQQYADGKGVKGLQQDVYQRHAHNDIGQMDQPEVQGAAEGDEKDLSFPPVFPHQEGTDHAAVQKLLINPRVQRQKHGAYRHVPRPHAARSYDIRGLGDHGKQIHKALRDPAFLKKAAELRGKILFIGEH